ncbi:MAG: hypothetical protein QOK43_1475 [Acidimicrobiaceae bacterium]|nr:hypothetical protein [Acidimicrobiaceae bacterium]
MRVVAAGLAACVGGVSLGACRPDGVRLAFRPRTGASYTYRVEVRAEVVTRIGDGEPRRRVDHDVLFADHAVLTGGPRSSRVQVRLRGPGQPTRTFVVALDRAAQLAEVQRIEGLPASALGTLGLSEIFPAAAGAPPDRLLAPGARWRVDEPVTLPGSSTARLSGQGRLVELGVVAGREVARVETTYRLPVDRTSDEAQGRIVLRGSQEVHARSTSGVADGAVESAETETRGVFTLSLEPRDGGPAVPGRLELVVRSVTRRLH